MEEKAEEALKQIKEKQYDAELRLEGYHTFMKYGITHQQMQITLLTITMMQHMIEENDPEHTEHLRDSLFKSVQTMIGGQVVDWG